MDSAARSTVAREAERVVGQAVVQDAASVATRSHADSAPAQVAVIAATASAEEGGEPVVADRNATPAPTAEIAASPVVNPDASADVTPVATTETGTASPATDSAESASVAATTAATTAAETGSGGNASHCRRRGSCCIGSNSHGSGSNGTGSNGRRTGFRGCDGHSGLDTQIRRSSRTGTRTHLDLARRRSSRRRRAASRRWRQRRARCVAQRRPESVIRSRPRTASAAARPAPTVPQKPAAPRVNVPVPTPGAPRRAQEAAPARATAPSAPAARNGARQQGGFIRAAVGRHAA